MPQVIEVPGVGPVEFPDGMTDDDIVRAIQGMEAGPQNPEWQARTRARARSIPPVDADPTSGMGPAQIYLAGQGLNLHEAWRGIQQRVGLRDGEDTTAQREQDQALRDNPLGRAGELSAPFVFTAPVASLRVLNTVRGAAGFGGAYGAAQPTETTGEAATNIALGTLAGGGGQYGANRLAGLFAPRLAAREAEIAARAGADVKQATFRRAQEMGYVAPPASVNPSAGNRAAGSITGQARTEQFASIHNQKLTDAAARRALGVDENTPLTPDTLNAVRREAGRVYDDIARSGNVRTDDQMLDELASIGQDSSLIRRAYPGVDDPGVTEILQTIDGLMVEEVPAQAAVAMVRRQRELANEAFRAGSNELGAAHREIAAAVEENLMRHLRANGNEAAADAFDAARRRYAITYTIEDALNEGAGEVAAQSLGAELRRGVPISGELADIARFAQAFRPSTQQLTKAPVSALDAAMGSGFATAVGFGTGNPLLTLAAAAAPAAGRGLVRKASLSPWWQRRFTTPNYDRNPLGTMLLQAPGAAANQGGALAALAALQSQ